MPELPEVETVKNVLKKIVIGHTITKIDVLRNKQILGNAIEFVNKLEGKKFLDVSRRGKYLFFHLEDDLVIISHLRMEGKYYEVNENDENTKYARVVFHLNNNHKICYDDSRCFGILKLSNESNYLKEKEVAKLGPEPFEIKDVSFMLERCKKSLLPIKTMLLDQSLMTGLGNIYVDETLYASKIHPLTPAKYITKKEWETIVKNAVEILNIAIEMGGSTIKSYHPGKGIDGNFQTRIKIYGRKDETCPICGKTYRFTKVGGRGTTFCPGCQHKCGVPITVAITGKIASGKSTVTAQFKQRGYDVISSDQIVHDLYQDIEIVNKIGKTLHIDFKDNKMDTDLLRNHLLINPNDKKKLERLIHPLVKKEIFNFFKQSKSKIKVAEVPLLFESKMDGNFDYIIATDIKDNIQNERLEKRNGNKGILLKEINRNNQFEQYKNKVEFLIENNQDIQTFENKINKIIDKLEENLN